MVVVLEPLTFTSETAPVNFVVKFNQCNTIVLSYRLLFSQVKVINCDSNVLNILKLRIFHLYLISRVNNPAC